MHDKKGDIVNLVLFIYVMCFMMRVGEYFILRTDQGFWGEAFLHKLAGIAIMVVFVKLGAFGFGEIGFINRQAGKSFLKGMSFGLLIFLPAYLMEILLLVFQGKFEVLGWYISAYSVDGSSTARTGFLFFAICIAGNLINVVMEEGVFRGLFQKMLEKKYSFFVAAIISSCLFGLWHIIAPLRSYFDGIMSFNGCLLNMLMLVITSGLVGFKFAMMTKLTGSLYMAMGDHFINNTLVNILHVVSASGTDELMTLRISIAQSFSFAVVFILYIKELRKGSQR